MCVFFVVVWGVLLFFGVFSFFMIVLWFLTAMGSVTGTYRPVAPRS